MPIIGSGKTTFLNTLVQYIPADERNHHHPTDERIITIEDSAELQIRSIPNVFGLETRNTSTERRGERTISDLIRFSLRMPNRIIVGNGGGLKRWICCRR